MLKFYFFSLILLLLLFETHAVLVDNPPCGGGDTMCDCVNIPGRHLEIRTDSTGALFYDYPLNTFTALPLGEAVGRVRLLGIQGMFNYSGSPTSTPVRFYIKRQLVKLLIGEINCVGSVPGKYNFSVSVDDYERYDTFGIDPVATTSFSVPTGCFSVLPSSPPEYVNALPTIMSTMLYSGLTPVSPLDQWTFSVENVDPADFVAITRVPDIRVCAIPNHVAHYEANWCSTSSPSVVGNYMPDECGRCQQRTAPPLLPFPDAHYSITSQILLGPGMVYGTCVDIYDSEPVVSQCPCSHFLPISNTRPVVWLPSTETSWVGSALPDIAPGEGQSVAISDNFILVGNPLAHPNPLNLGIEQGVAQLFVRTVAPPFASLLVYTAQSVGGQYGHAVALDEPNEYAIVSNPMAVTLLSQGDGEVYIYRTFSDTLLQTLRISDTGLAPSMTTTGFGWRFGESVLVHDGVLAIGISEITLSNITNVGAVAIFRLNMITGFYDFETVLYPENPTIANQFYGISVAYQETYLLVGTRYNQVYLYKDIGGGVWLNIENPSPPGFPPSPVSEYGVGVDIQLPFFSVSDRNSLVSPSARGRIYLFELLSPIDIRLVRVYNDTQLSLNTQFGTGMANSYRYVVAGAPLTAPYGAAYIIPIYPPPCFDCNNVFNGGAVINACNQCEVPQLNGTLLNSGCVGCDGIPNSGLKNDYCGVCNGTNTTCLVVLPEPPLLELICNDFGILNLDNEPAKNDVNWTITGPPFKGVASINVKTGELHYGATYGENGIDSIIVQVVDNYGHTVSVTVIVDIQVTCTWCDGSIGPIGPILDICDVCGGDGLSCVDCDGVPYGPNLPDECGVCHGNSNTCLNGIVGDNFISDCFVQFNIPLKHTPTTTIYVSWSLVAPFATKGTVTLFAGAKYIQYVGREGETGNDQIGWKIVDNYGNMDTGIINIAIVESLDCNGVQCGPSVVDGCGLCGGFGTTCIGCDGVYASGVFYDLCGVCGGDSSTCVDCFGVPDGPAFRDGCGICGGDGTTCMITGNLDPDLWKWFILSGFLFTVFGLTFLCIHTRNADKPIHPHNYIPLK